MKVSLEDNWKRAYSNLSLRKKDHYTYIVKFKRVFHIRIKERRPMFYYERGLSGFTFKVISKLSLPMSFLRFEKQLKSAHGIWYTIQEKSQHGTADRNPPQLRTKLERIT